MADSGTSRSKMSKKEWDSLFCPAPQVVQDFCLEELYPQYLFRYLTPRTPPKNEELHLCSLVLSNSPSDFVLQLDADRRISDRLSFKLGQLYETPEKKAEYRLGDEFMHPGVPVSARYTGSDDLRWYRAIIVDIDKDPEKQKPINVRFVDFGNYQHCDRNQVQLMPIDMGNEPPLAIKGRLKGTVEGEEYENEIIQKFLIWANSTLKQRLCFASFVDFDTAANQFVVRLYNAENGEEFLLPPGGRKQPKRLVETAAVGNLISLDEEAQTENVADLFGHSVSTMTVVETNRPLRFAEELRAVFEAGTSSAAASSSRVTKEVDHKEAQTDLSLVSNADQQAEGGGGDCGSSSGRGEYDPFTDPAYESLRHKYPKLMKYLRYPETHDKGK